MIINFNKEIYNVAYIPLIDCNSRYVKIRGGAGSGKSFYVALTFLKKLLSPQRRRMLLVRKVAKTIRESQYYLLKDIAEQYNLSQFISFHDASLRIKSKINYKNEIISFGIDNREKIKSIHGITDVWIEEATELTQEDFLQIDLRIRGITEVAKQIYLTFNPISALHWLNKIKLKDCTSIRTTYKHNRFLDEQYKRRLEELKEQNLNYYNVYVLGLWGILEETVYQLFNETSNFPELYDEVYYGLDFGYNHPTALLKIGVKDGNYYLQEMLYKSGYTNSMLIDKLKTFNIGKNDYIFCDSAEPNRIEEIKSAGFNAVPSDKSVKDGIDFVRSKFNNIYSHPSNTNLKKENIFYSYKKDKNGNILDEPIKEFDDLLCALRYALYTRSKLIEKKKFKMAFY